MPSKSVPVTAARSITEDIELIVVSKTADVSDVFNSTLLCAVLNGAGLTPTDSQYMGTHALHGFASSSPVAYPDLSAQVDSILSSRRGQY